MMPGQFAGVFYRGGAAFVGPAWQRTTEAAGEDHVGDLVRQDRVEDPLGRTLDVHPPTIHLPAVKQEGGGPASSEVRAHVDRHRAGLRPVGHGLTGPENGQLPAILLRSLADLLGQLGIRRLHDEVGCPVTGPREDEQGHNHR